MPFLDFFELAVEIEPIPKRGSVKEGSDFFIKDVLGRHGGKDRADFVLLGLGFCDFAGNEERGGEIGPLGQKPKIGLKLGKGLVLAGLVVFH